MSLICEVCGTALDTAVWCPICEGKKVKRLLRALERYGVHDGDCNFVAYIYNLSTPAKPCSCGYADALAAAKEEP